MKSLALAFLLYLPVCAEDYDDPRKDAQLASIASAAEHAADGNRRMLALLLSTGFVETKYSLRIHDGHCATWECDHGRARGPWQTWRNGMTRKEWTLMRGLGHTEEQALAARNVLARGLKMCGTVQGAIARYVGLPCDARGPSLMKRFEWYQRAYRALRKDDAS